MARFAIFRRHRSTTTLWCLRSVVASTQRLNATWAVRFSMYLSACSAFRRACSASFMSATSVTHCWKLAASTRLQSFPRHRWTTARWCLSSCHVIAHWWKYMKSSRFLRPRRNFSALASAWAASCTACMCSVHRSNAPASSRWAILARHRSTSTRCFFSSSHISAQRSKAAAVWRLAIFRKHRSTSTRWLFCSAAASTHWLKDMCRERFSMYLTACAAFSKAC